MATSKSRRMIIVCAAATLAIAACSSTRTQKSVGEHIDDAVLVTKIKADLVADPVTAARHIDITVFKGRVQLNGFVDSNDEKMQAGKVARGVRGVKNVENNLKLRGAERTAGQVIDDATIMAHVKAALIADGRTKAHQIEVETHSGVVQLAGFVDSNAARTAAVELARGVDGVSRVDDRIAIK